ncbi:MAG TPA: hypothetical protein VLF89_06145 [Candidatus Saccharimonadales bacterium]|nr:hypothetical protein [Candidatus Saccharimonadales bacterium]
MKYIVFTFDGSGTPVAQHLQLEGQDVTLAQVVRIENLSPDKELDYIEARKDKEMRLSLFEGVVKKKAAEELIKEMKTYKNPQDYFVFFDTNGLYPFAEEIKDLGFHGNFPTHEDYLYETDRDKAKEFVKKHYNKLNVARKKEFTSISDAKKFLADTDEVWVLKSNQDDASAFVPNVDDPILAARQVIEVLDKDSDAYGKDGFILELLIPSVIELTPERLYYDGELIATSIMIENKPIGSGNISIPTGCAADLVFPIPPTDRINQVAFPPIVDEIAKKRKGLFYWDASILINKRDGKMYFGEFCPNRPGYNSSFTEFAQCGSVHEFFEKAVQKKNPFTIGTVATSVKIFNLHRNNEDQQILGGLTVDFSPEVEKDVWLWDVKKKGKKLTNIGYGDCIAVITGSGKSIEEAVNRMYRNLDKFSFMGAYYRPKADYVSLGYPTSIFNRLNYGMERGLYQIPFNVKVGDIM